MSIVHTIVRGAPALVLIVSIFSGPEVCAEIDQESATSLGTIALASLFVFGSVVLLNGLFSTFLDKKRKVHRLTLVGYPGLLREPHQLIFLGSITFLAFSIGGLISWWLIGGELGWVFFFCTGGSGAIGSYLSMRFWSSRFDSR